MLHIHNGESSAISGRLSDIPGNHVAQNEALIDGPSPQGLSEGQWRSMRADHLAKAYGVPRATCEDDIKKQEKILAGFPRHEEVVLWYEHDLFCQTNLIYLLNWFARRELGRTKLSLVCIDRFPGIEDFRGLGQLTPKQLGSLFAQRHEITKEMMLAGTEAWKAYCSPTPESLKGFISEEIPTLPFLRQALRFHLSRFPSISNGIGRVGNCILTLVNSGRIEFLSVFTEFGKQEPIFGLGDSQFWNEIRRLTYTTEPLLLIAGFDPGLEGSTRDAFIRARLSLTDFGRAVMCGLDDFLAHNEVDYWLGGVHLHATNLWRWDESKQLLTKELNKDPSLQ